MQVDVDELFLSLQGEAGEIGRPHLFLRLGGCPLRCSYCDTPRSWHAQAGAELHLPSETRTLANPLSREALDAACAELLRAHGAEAAPVVLAVTGGEPLVQAEFLNAWLPTQAHPVLLETAGVYVDALRTLLPMLRFVSLDAKDPADLRAGAELDAHLECWQACAEEAAARSEDRPLEFWIKFIVHRDTDYAALESRLEALAALVPNGRVFLQPVTPRGRGPQAADPQALLQLSLRPVARKLDMRVLPQVHPLLTLR